jgi:hypothetical protein
VPVRIGKRLLAEGEGRIIALSEQQCKALMTAALASGHPDLWLFVAFGLDDWLPKPHILHPWPSQRFAVTHRQLWTPQPVPCCKMRCEVVTAVQMAMLRGLPYTKLRDAVITHPTNRNLHTTFLNKTWGCALPKKDDSLSRVRRRFKSWLHGRFEPWRVALYGGIRVHYKDWLDGGGSSFGQEVIPFLRDRGMPSQARVFEWCAGPAFIGFSMLGHGLCETLCLADINPMAVTACRRTIAANGLGGSVTVYHSDNLSAIPIEEQWDLVVGSPPFFDNPAFHLRAHDRGWHLHREFFATIGRFLRSGGVIVLQENNLGSTAEIGHALGNVREQLRKRKILDA